MVVPPIESTIPTTQSIKLQISEASMKSCSLILICIILSGLFGMQNALANENSKERFLGDLAVKDINDMVNINLQNLRVQATEKGSALHSILQELGFPPTDQMQPVEVRQGFPMYVVGLEKLKRYKKGDDPWALLSQTSTIIFPLSIEQDKEFKTRSAVTVAYQRDKNNSFIPRIVEMGNPVLIRLLTEARVESQKESRCNQPSDCFVVTVPALGLHLFGYHNSTTKEFKLLVLNQVLGQVKRGDLRTAQEVVTQLSNDARTGQYDRPRHTPNKKMHLPPNSPITGEKTNATMD